MTNPGQHILPGADFTREVPLPPQPPLEDERIDWSVCHCGRNADGSLMGYCAHCSSVRCDAFPGACSQPAPSCSKSGSSDPSSSRAELLARHREELDAWWAEQVRDHDRLMAEANPEPGSSEDEVIPQAAIAAAARAACEATYPSNPNGRAKVHDPWEAIEEWERDAWRATVTAALNVALPHLRAFQIETQVRVGYELGRREAQGECAGVLEDRASGEGLDEVTRKVLRGMAATIAPEVTKGDPK